LSIAWCGLYDEQILSILIAEQILLQFLLKDTGWFTSTLTL
jgi:hypothetical protein